MITKQNMLIIPERKMKIETRKTLMIIDMEEGPDGVWSAKVDITVKMLENK